MPANNSFSIPFTSYEIDDGNAVQKFDSIEEFDQYYDTVIEPQIISLLKEKGLLTEDIKDIEDDPNIEYDDSLICLDNRIPDISFSDNIIDQYQSLKQEIDEVLLDEKSSPITVNSHIVKIDKLISSYPCG